MGMSKGLSIGDLARVTRVNLETIRYYERVGLMPAPARTAGGHRLYESGHQRRLEFIRRARELGFRIEDVRQLLALADTSAQPCEAVREIAAKHLIEVRAKIADLGRLERVLDETVTRCASTIGTPRCPVLEMLDGVR